MLPVLVPGEHRVHHRLRVGGLQVQAHRGPDLAAHVPSLGAGLGGDGSHGMG